MNEPAISIQNVWKFFGDFAAVREVSFEVPPGTILALLGRNGAGKTTMLRMMAGLSRPSRGDISISGRGWGKQNSSAVGVVGHGEWIYDDLSARENLEFFGRLYKVDDLAGSIDRWLETVGLSRFRNARVSEFSRGMRQRLAIARAFLHDPRVLLLDEPWTALDDRATQLLSSLLRDAQSRGCSVVVCSHQLREALEVATRVAVIDRGKLIFQGPNSDDFKAAPEDFYQKIS